MHNTIMTIRSHTITMNSVSNVALQLEHIVPSLHKMCMILLYYG